jgi:NTP pyrophosphatase (non-canonical NTP hydrolase)
MGLHKNEGQAAAALAEECGEVVQIISKYYRFGGDWNEVPPGKSKTRWQQLIEEMDDLFYQWHRVKKEQGLK